MVRFDRDLQGNDVSGPRGHCGVTEASTSGSNEPCRADQQRGAWTTTRLRHCLALCASCTQCRFVSFSSAWTAAGTRGVRAGRTRWLRPRERKMAAKFARDSRGARGRRAARVERARAAGRARSLPARVALTVRRGDGHRRALLPEHEERSLRRDRWPRRPHVLQHLLRQPVPRLERAADRPIEANLANYAALLHNLPLRPGVTAAHSAVCAAPNSLANFTEGGGARAIDVSLASEGFKQAWHSGRSSTAGNSGAPGAHNTVATPCAPMSDLLRHEPTTIQLLSVDVEGSEYAVLSTVDWCAPAPLETGRPAHVLCASACALPSLKHLIVTVSSQTGAHVPSRRSSSSSTGTTPTRIGA